MRELLIQTYYQFQSYLIRLARFIINQTELCNEGEVISYLVIVT